MSIFQLNGDRGPRANGAERPVTVYNLRYGPALFGNGGGAAEGEEKERDVAGGWLLAVASVLLLALAIAQGYVSYRAQYVFVYGEKREVAASTLEALGLDAAAVIFALLALALARLGRPAIPERSLNLACVAGSLMMNALGADFSSVKSIAAWTLPAALYAAGSDRLIAVVRRRALARTDGGDRDGSRLAAALLAVLRAVKGVALWLLRLVLAPYSTLAGFRRWVVETAPVAPGRRGGQAQPDTFTAFGRWVVDPATKTKRGWFSRWRSRQPGTPAATVADTKADTSPAIEAAKPDTKPDTKADTGADTKADNVRSLRPANRPKVTGHQADTGADSQADRARALLAADPDMSGAELGRRLGIHERTARRLRLRLVAELAEGLVTGRSNGSEDGAGQ